MLKEIPSIPDFTAIKRRTSKLNIQINKDKYIASKDEYIIIVIDGTAKVEG
ncbi:MAG TPA: hypothetical protein VN704_04405 [Verrucomicrobiae bacterium]|nr:hypothetical protein [Verrucomicrobiae bacterium]